MAWWNPFRSKTSESDRPDFSAPPIHLGKQLVYDVHSHLVPGVDDGAETLEDSLALIERLVKLGYSGAVLTPHIHSDIYPNSERTLRPAFDTIGFCGNGTLACIPFKSGRRVLFGRSFRRLHCSR